jgi:ubiquinone/menaquinone biosynthesis C-methylase UbiE
MAARVSNFGRARHLLRSYIVHGRVRVVLQYLFAKFQWLFIQPTILPYFITFFPYKRSSYAYWIPREKPPYEHGKTGLPNPPERIWSGYGPTIDEYLSSGKQAVTKMREVLTASGYEFKAGDRVFEMGCAAGRMLRWLEDVSDKCEVWGTDISGEHIMWCKQNLSPPFHFFITTTNPHLPFPDNYFDVIYAGSVFTHIDDLSDAWMLELRRIMKPGGRAYITIHDNHTIRVLSEQRNLDLSKTLFCRPDFFEKNDYGMFTIGRFMRSQVFVDTDYFTNSLKPFWQVLSVTPEAYGFQTAVLLQKQ